jgi:hypothetical protein
MISCGRKKMKNFKKLVKEDGDFHDGFFDIHYRTLSRKSFGGGNQQ